MPLKTGVTSGTKSRSVLSEVSLCLHTCFCMYVYTVCVGKCVIDTVGYVLFIYLRAEEVNKWPGRPLPEVTMDLHM